MVQPRDDKDTGAPGRSSLPAASPDGGMRRGIKAIADRLTGSWRASRGAPAGPDEPSDEDLELISEPLAPGDFLPAALGVLKPAAFKTL